MLITKCVSVRASFVEHSLLLLSSRKGNSVGGTIVVSDASARVSRGCVPSGNYEFKGANLLSTVTTVLMVSEVFSLEVVHAIIVPCML